MPVHLREAKMISCDRCHKEYAYVPEYFFYYGTKSSSSYKKAQWFAVAGRDFARVCNCCVTWGQVFYGFIALALSAFLFYCGYVFKGGKAICTGIAVLLLVGLMVYIFTHRKEVGELLAIRTKRKWLRAQKYSAIPAVQHASMLMRGQIR
jgi:hypothetical protein